jgi:DnaJ-class molecular chaperone
VRVRWACLWRLFSAPGMALVPVMCDRCEGVGYTRSRRGGRLEPCPACEATGLADEHDRAAFRQERGR